MTAPIQVRRDGLSPDGRWYTDSWGDGLLWSVEVQGVLRDLQTPYQHLRVLQTARLGRLMVLDHAVQVAEADEAAYHELIVHPGLCRKGSRDGERKVLVIGGGDGGAAREALRHPDVVRVDLVELDPEVPRAARELLPSIWRRPVGEGPLEDDPRFHLQVVDGARFVQDTGERYDLIVVDSTDPVGPGEALFTRAFYEGLAGLLQPGGAVAVQAGSWFFLPRALQLALRGLGEVFERVRAYQCWSAIYPGGLWNLVIATPGDDPAEVDVNRADALSGCAYYSAAVHAAAFALPPAVQEVIAGVERP
ncbi:MAG: polyamine aminopropyltransferase [Deltaproteobacteria bacterium]|nr:polyamine aminopropyltransferase [Deltaproteobacteria bacterium]